MNKPMPKCDGFHDIGDDEFLIEVWGADDGYVDEFTVSRLLDGGETEPYEPKTPEENDKWQERAQEIYNGYCESFCEHDFA